MKDMFILCFLAFLGHVADRLANSINLTCPLILSIISGSISGSTPASIVSIFPAAAAAEERSAHKMLSADTPKNSQTARKVVREIPTKPFSKLEQNLGDIPIFSENSSRDNPAASRYLRIWFPTSIFICFLLSLLLKDSRLPTISTSSLAADKYSRNALIMAENH